MNIVVAGNDVAGAEDVVAALKIADEAAGLADQHHPGSQVPGVEVALPIPSKRPAATQARSSVAAPKRRTPATRG